MRVLDARVRGSDDNRAGAWIDPLSEMEQLLLDHALLFELGDFLFVIAQ